MTTTERDKMLILVLPAAAVLAGYLFLLSPKERDEVDKAQKELKALQAQAPSPAVLALKSAKLDQAKEEMKQLEKEIAELQRDWGRLAGLSYNRSEKVELLTGLFKQHGLTVLEQGAADGRDGNLPRGLDALSKRYPTNQVPQVWRFRISGNYAGLRKVLEQLAGGEPLAVPLGLSMKEGDLDSDIREWTLVVWI